MQPPIGVVFNQQKLYIRNLHLYSIAPAQCEKKQKTLSISIREPPPTLWVRTIYKRLIIIFEICRLKSTQRDSFLREMDFVLRDDD